MEEIIFFSIVLEIVIVGSLIYYVKECKQLRKQVGFLEAQSNEQKDNIHRLVSLFHNLFFVEKLSKNHVATMAVQFFSRNELAKYGWEKGGYSIDEFYDGGFDDLPEKMFADEKAVADFIMMENQPEVLGLTRHAFFLKTLPKKLKDLSEDFNYSVFSYKVFIKRYTAIFSDK